jgi:hypothetical protein
LAIKTGTDEGKIETFLEDFLGVTVTAVAVKLVKLDPVYHILP